jgi:FdhD protein
MPSCAEQASVSPAGYVRRLVERWRDSDGEHVEDVEDVVAEEVPIAMLFNGQPFAVMMASPLDLEDFALGFSLTEGLIHSPGQLIRTDVHSRLEGIELSMTVATDAPAVRIGNERERLLPGRAGCGICGSRILEDVLRQPPVVHADLRVTARALQQALRGLGLHQPLNAATGAVHAAAWADADGRILLAREDVGRHNALDKLIGAMHRTGCRADAGMLLLTSRASYEMVTKAASVGIALVAAISAPTGLAIEMARSAGVCLVGFARPGSYNVYTHPDRLRVADAIARSPCIRAG